MWGGQYGQKPQAQVIFEVEVQKAVQSVIAATEKDSQDFRPRIKDLNTNTYFLIDTGACLSVFPKSACPNAKLDENRGLQAVNGTTMPTYGTKIVNIRLDRKSFQQEMVIADIGETPILGWNFLVNHKIDIIWTHNKCMLYCGRTKNQYQLHLGRANSEHLNLAPIDLSNSFKQWSQKHKSAPKKQVSNFYSQALGPT